MALPLPKIIPDVGPGGYVLDAMQARNVFHQSQLANKMQELKNRESEIKLPFIEPNEREALLKAQQYNKMYIPNIQSQIGLRGAQTNKLNTMTPLEARQLELANEMYRDVTNADIQNKLAMARNRNLGGSNATADMKNLNSFNQQIRLENPQEPNEDPNAYNQRIDQLQSAYLADENVLPSGQPIKPLSGTGRQKLLNIQAKNAPVAVKNQAANMDVLYENMKDFDINAVKAFAGPKGKAKLLYAKANMATNPNDPNIDPMARRFITAMNDSIANMDSMRKAWGTSIVPDYVYATIGRLSNPASDIWSDPVQVGQNWKSITDRIRKDRDLLYKKVRSGVTAGFPETNENKNLNNSKHPSQMTTEEIQAELASMGVS